MAVSLAKGQKVDLTKNHPGLKDVLIGLGWDTNKYDGGKDFDLDASAFLLTASGKVRSDADFVFYGNLKHESGSVEHIRLMLKKSTSPLQSTKLNNANRILDKLKMRSFA